MTPVREAVRRGDLGWLTAHLGVEQCTPDVLRPLVRHDDPRLRHLGLDRLAARIARPRAEFADLAALLPDTVDGPPETALLLAHLHQRLWRHVPERRRPDWRAADLPAGVRIAWLRAEIVNRPGTVHTEPSGELLHQAVAGIAAADAAQPDELVRQLAAGADPVLRTAAVRLVREALHAALLSPARARAHLDALLDTAPDDVLRELTAPWAALTPLPRRRLDPFAHRAAAIGAAARHGHAGGRATRSAAEQALRRFPEHADVLAVQLQDRLGPGSWGLLELVAGRPLLRTPALTEICRRLRADGRDDLADRITVVDGPVRDPGAADCDAAALVALRERPPPVRGPGGPSRDELFHLIRTGHTEQARRALTRLAEAHEDGPATSDPALESLLGDLLHHREPRLRMHAHRIGRKVLDRPTYLRHTAVLLTDPEPGLVRAAVRTLGHAAYRPAVPTMVGLLTHRHPTVSRTAASALIQFGLAAIPALTSAAGHARPDRRHLYLDVIDRITERADPAPDTT